MVGRPDFGQAADFLGVASREAGEPMPAWRISASMETDVILTCVSVGFGVVVTAATLIWPWIPKYLLALGVALILGPFVFLGFQGQIDRPSQTPVYRGSPHKESGTGPTPKTKLRTSPPLAPGPTSSPPTSSVPQVSPTVAAALTHVATAKPPSGPHLIALEGSQIVIQPDGQPLDRQLSVRFINGQTAPPAYHLRVWLAPIYFDDLPKTKRDLSQFDPEALGEPVSSNEYSLTQGQTLPVYVDGFRPNHPLNAPGVQAIYAYYVYVDSSNNLHEPKPSIFVFDPRLPGFTELGLKEEFPEAWVRTTLLRMGRQSVRYSDMIGDFGER